MTRSDILNKFQKFIVWERRGERAPHKPLLILYPIGKLLLGEEHLRVFLSFGFGRSVLMLNLP